jgi:hypothetical protein
VKLAILCCSTVSFSSRELLVLLLNCWNKQLMTVDLETVSIYSKWKSRPAYGDSEKAQISGIDNALVFFQFHKILGE